MASFAPLGKRLLLASEREDCGCWAAGTASAPWRRAGQTPSAAGAVVGDTSSLAIPPLPPSVPSTRGAATRPAAGALSIARGARLWERASRAHTAWPSTRNVAAPTLPSRMCAGLRRRPGSRNEVGGRPHHHHEGSGALRPHWILGAPLRRSGRRSRGTNGDRRGV